MKKQLIISVLLIFSSLTFSNNYFIYLRYNPLDGNSSLIVNKINEIINGTNENFVIFYSKNQPVIAKTKDEWDNIQNDILAKQSNSDFYQDKESILLDNLFNEIFNESVIKDYNKKLELKGKNDTSWECIFILSDNMYDTDAQYIPYECIEINELDKRMTIKYITYNEETITIKR